MKIGVVGCGHVGLVTAVGLATVGHDVTAIDISRAQVEAIRQGKVPFHEPGVQRALAKVLAAQRLRVGDEFRSVTSAEVIFLCVGTPPADHGRLDLSMLRAAAGQVAQAVRGGEHYQVVAVRSTVVPTTTESVVRPVIEEGMRFRAQPLGLAVNPEFLREGSAWDDFLNPDRIVIGELDQRSGETLSKVYEAFDAPVLRTGLAAAEMIKFASNALLATLISFSNEIARLCECFRGVDAEDVFAGLHLDRRLVLKVDGRRIPSGVNQYLRAGCGFGGSCLPKDLKALIRLAKSKGLEAALLSAVEATNESQRLHLLRLAERFVGKLSGRRVLVLGLSFKDGTDDVRDSPGVSLARELARHGAFVKVADPLVGRQQVKGLLDVGVEFAADAPSAFLDCEVCFITTSAQEFRFVETALATGAPGSKRPVVVDGRRVVSRRTAGVADNYVGIGRGPHEGEERRARGRQT